MRENLIKISWKKLASAALTAVFALTLTACGGGGGSAGGSSSSGGTTDSDGTVASVGSITLVLTDSSGQPSNALSGTESLTATATVRDENDAPVEDIIVTFSLTAGSTDLAELSQDTDLTSANGAATAGLSSTSQGSGAVQVTATATVNGVELTVSANFSVGADPSAPPAAITFESMIPEDGQIVKEGSALLGRTEIAILKFKVTDATDQGVANQTVLFTPSQAGVVTLVDDTGVTDVDGFVQVALTSGESTTPVGVLATVSGTSITADATNVVTVTTGEPLLTGFSLNLDRYNPEGLDVSGTEVDVTVYLVDDQGQEVGDGTQVVFSATAGGVYNIDEELGAMCLTVNGACEDVVKWRSQVDERAASGVATITATATNSSGNFSKSVTLMLSGSEAEIRYPESGAAVTSIADLDFSSSCAEQSRTIRLVDENGHTMPAGTTLSIVNASNASATIYPSEVHVASGVESGTLHEFRITPDGCDQGETGTLSGSFTIKVETPYGFITDDVDVDLGAFPAAPI